jgi:hypothetical protein
MICHKRLITCFVFESGLVIQSNLNQRCCLSIDIPNVVIMHSPKNSLI